VKRNILFGAAIWLVLITTLHLHLNVGWARLASRMQVWLGNERPELVVGFLPVT
jgi:hypothetical protein